MSADDEGLAAAASVLQAGGVVLLPTDTTYGLAALATEPDAVAQLFVLKRRPAERSIAVLVADLDQATELAELSEAEQAVADAFWPGALTLVLRRRSSVSPSLGKADGTIAVRRPAAPFVAALAADLGPLATTSANLSGEPPATRPNSAAASLDGDVGLVIDDGDRSQVASTVAGIGDDGTVTIFRLGDLSEAAIAAVFDASDLAGNRTGNEI